MSLNVALNLPQVVSDSIIIHPYSAHLSPVLEEVLTEDVLLGVLVVQHLGKEPCGFLSLLREFHWSSIIDKLHMFWQWLV